VRPTRGLHARGATPARHLDADLFTAGRGANEEERRGRTHARSLPQRSRSGNLPGADWNISHDPDHDVAVRHSADGPALAVHDGDEPDVLFRAIKRATSKTVLSIGQVTEFLVVTSSTRMRPPETLLNVGSGPT